MNTLHHISSHITHPTLRSCCLMTDGNSHRPDLLQKFCHHADLISEAMLPEIRTIATLIATQRHDFNQPSPTEFTDEADWFAARILLLNVRVFHLEISKLAMLKLANQRAAQFAKQHGLPFQAACIRASLHTSRPANMLLMECDLSGKAHRHFVANTLAIKPQLCQILGKLR